MTGKRGQTVLEFMIQSPAATVCFLTPFGNMTYGWASEPRLCHALVI